MTILFINADDFGLHKNVNMAIVESLNNGLGLTTSLMANGDAFEDACELVQENRINENSVGIHINLTAGIPLSQPIRKNKLFCNEQGMFDGRAWNAPYIFDHSTKETVGIEISCQINRCLNNLKKIAHADSHHHIHTHPAIANIMIPLLKEVGINKIRLSRNCGSGIPLIKKIYKIIFNNRLKNSGLQTADYFGSVKDINWLVKHKNISCRNIEIMIHPNFNHLNQLVDLDGSFLNETIRPLINYFKGEA